MMTTNIDRHPKMRLPNFPITVAIGVFAFVHAVWAADRRRRAIAKRSTQVKQSVSQWDNEGGRIPELPVGGVGSVQPPLGSTPATAGPVAEKGDANSQPL